MTADSPTSSTRAEHSGPARKAGPLAGAGTNPLGTSSTDVGKGSAKLGGCALAMTGPCRKFRPKREAQV